MSEEVTNIDDYINGLSDEPEAVEELEAEDNPQGDVHSEAVDKEDDKPEPEPEVKEEPKPQAIKVKVKVDGQEQEEELSIEQIQRDYQKFKAADARFQEAAAMRKQAEEFVSMLKTKPADVLNQLGLNVREMAEAYLIEQIEDESLSPEQKELKKAQKRLAEIEAQKEAETKKAQTEQAKALQAKYQEDYQNQIISALESSGLPKTKSTVKRMAYYLHQSVVHGLDLKASDVVDRVREDYIAEQKELFSELDADTLIKFLGSDVADKIRKHSVQQFKQGRKGETKSHVGPSKGRKEKKTISFKDLDDYIDNL